MEATIYMEGRKVAWFAEAVDAYDYLTHGEPTFNGKIYRVDTEHEDYCGYYYDGEWYETEEEI